MLPPARTQLCGEWVVVRDRVQGRVLRNIYEKVESGLRRGGEEVGRPGERHNADAKKVCGLMESGMDLVKSSQKGRAMDMGTNTWALTTNSSS